MCGMCYVPTSRPTSKTNRPSIFFHYEYFCDRRKSLIERFTSRKGIWVCEFSRYRIRGVNMLMV